jgi:hypothetical protein
MPTSIPVYKFGSKARDELASCTRALLDFYGLVGEIVLLLLVFETYFVMFDGLSAAQALLAVTGMAMTPGLFVSIM